MAKKKRKEKNKTLKQTESEIIKKYGEGSIYTLGSRKGLNVDAFSSGLYSLDLATGVGGLPKGRVIEIFGPESSGKSTLGLCILASAQKKGLIAVYIDAEHAFDPVYGKRIGIKENLLVNQPDSGDQALDIVESLILSNKVDVILVDSVANLVPEAELRGDMGDQTIGLMARMMSRAFRRITPALGKSKTCLIFINQVRDKISGYGNPETTPGGRALRFASSIRIRLRFVEPDKSLGGFRIKGTLKKNKVAAPYTEFSFLIDSNFKKSKGIVKWVDRIETAIEVGLLQKKRNGMILYGKNKFRGMKSFRDKILKDKKKCAAFLKSLRKAIKDNG